MPRMVFDGLVSVVCADKLTEEVVIIFRVTVEGVQVFDDGVC